MAYLSYDKSQFRKAITSYLKKVTHSKNFFKGASLELLQGFDTALKDRSKSTDLVNRLKGQLKTKQSLQLKDFFKYPIP